MEQRINEIAESLCNVCNEFSLKVSDDVFFREVLTCYRGEQIGQPKEPLIKEIKEKPFEKLTKKQLDAIYGYGIKTKVKPELLSKQEAIQLIKTHKEKQ
jgi:hypothetical protein